MKAAHPATTASEILDEVNARVFVGGRFVDTSDFAWRSLKRRAEQLRTVDAGQGWAVYGAVVALAGLYEETERAFSAAQKLLGNDGAVISNWMVNRTNLGRYSEALELGIQHATPETGWFQERYGSLVRAGGFQAATERLQRAKAMHMEMSEMEIKDVSEAAAILRDAGVSDRNVAAQLDVAGRMLFDAGLMHVGWGSIEALNEPDLFVGVTYTLRLDLTPTEVFEMNVALAQAECEAGIVRNPAFDVSFVSTQC